MRIASAIILAFCLGLLLGTVIGDRNPAMPDQTYFNQWQPYNTACLTHAVSGCELVR